MAMTVTNDNFDQLTKAHALMVLDFWAIWCEPCHSFSQVIAQMAKRHADIFFGKVDVEAEAALAKDFAIQSVPTLVIIKNGVAIFQQSGAIPAAAVEDLIEQARQVPVA